MTGPYDDGPTGFFDHLDDAAPPAPGREVLDTVVHRGRRIRARRQGMFAASGAAAVAVAVLGGLGISHAVNAGSDRVVTPANTPTPSLSASPQGSHHRRPGDAVLVPRAGQTPNAPSPSTVPSAGPCGEPQPTPQPSQSPPPIDVGGPVAQSSFPPIVPSASAEPCPSESPSESPSPSESQSPSPEETPTEEPTSSPGVPFPSEPADG
jgi:hypothetical protein